MMIGDSHRSNPTVHNIQPWDRHFIGDPTAHIHYPDTSPSYYEKALLALQRYLPSNINDVLQAEDEDSDDFDVPVDAFSSDNFRMFDFKVKRCSRSRSHDWTECPFAHPGEKARRRDPRKYHYSGSACPDFRNGECKKDDACEYAHGVFECWLHPARYRTQPCKDGTNCHRRVCFFAHTPDQLRVLPNTASPDSSPTRPGYDPYLIFGSSPKSTLYAPPSSPTTCSPFGSPHLSQLTESMRGLQLNKVQVGLGMGFGSPRSPLAVRAGFVTPIRGVSRSGIGYFEEDLEEEPVMERVESGRELRERIYEKLGRENSLDRFGGSVRVGSF
ncbi:hypothetical protein ACJIZ3_004888 [Penstemon smallii]|uniref:C3H1-type domain-containing protein n=1 Tax=Penstemon smallii TaxID=265156 RepID=A0ABD3S3K2_9LAMI